MIVRYQKYMGGGEAVTYRDDFTITNIGVILVSDNADETLIPWSRVIDVVRYRSESLQDTRTIRDTVRNLP